MNIERNTPELLIKSLGDNLYMRFDKSNPRYKENAQEIQNLYRSSEASQATMEQDDNESNNKRFIFIRLYDPVYKGKINPTNLLKRGQDITNVNKINASHAAINYNLKDKFWGLTGLKTEAEHDFAIESCTNIQNNSYMNGCDPNKSTCTVYYISCSDQEYTKCKNLIIKFARMNEISYDILHNFVMAIDGIKRKFFSKKKIIGQESVEILSYESASAKVEKIPDKFVCSTLCAYILFTTISKVRNWFNNHSVNYTRVTPSDLSAVRGMKKAFTCSWNEYNTKVKEYAEKHPEMKEYL